MYVWYTYPGGPQTPAPVAAPVHTAAPTIYPPQAYPAPPTIAAVNEPLLVPVTSITTQPIPQQIPITICRKVCF